MKAPSDQTETPAPAQTTPKVTGIGGIFFISDNSNELRAWYLKNLGIESEEWGATFESRNISKSDDIDTFVWAPFKKGSDYFAPSQKEFMINYRVQNIEGFVEQLKANGVTVLDAIADNDFGKFAHVLDLEGNKIELWEPKN